MLKPVESSLQDITCDLLVIGIFQDRLETPRLEALPASVREALRASVQVGDFKGQKDDWFLIYPTGGDHNVSRILFAGLGKFNSISAKDLRYAGGKIAGKLREYRARIPILVIPFEEINEDWRKYGIQAFAEGIVLASYVEKFFKGEQKSSENAEESVDYDLTEVSIQLLFDPTLPARALDKAVFERSVQRGEILASAQNDARKLSNAPLNHATPFLIAESAREILEPLNVEFKILDEEALTTEGCRTILSVAAGSAPKYAPRLLVMDYRPNKPRQTIALVGKGICFDTGGYSLKNASNMERMKHDMSGAAAVINVVAACARLEIPHRVVGITPLTPNMVSGGATVPGDIIKSRSGITIEIINTDAEGRLILADGLDMACDYDPDIIIDMATLTGSCRVALGEFCSGLFTTDDELAALLSKAGEQTHERVWRLPLWDEYTNTLKSDLADTKNVGTRFGGASVAAGFLSKFVRGEKVRWAHLDVVATAYHYPPPSYLKFLQPGATGVPVRLLVYFLEQL